MISTVTMALALAVLHPDSVRSDTISVPTPAGAVGGTLTLPAKCPCPVALIISGSGPTDRDGNSIALPGANNSLKYLAEALAAKGIATVRYDKRGVGTSRALLKSESDIRFDDYVADAAAWVTKLRGDRRFTTVSVIGHSEGSLVGMLAARLANADGFVSIAGIGRRAPVVLHEQLAKQLPPEVLAQADRALATLERGQTTDSAPPMLAALFRPSVQPYLISWFRYDPAAEIARLTMPVLIAQGTTDIQVAVADAQALAKAQPQARLALIDGMNHVLKMVPPDQAAQMRSYGDPTLPIAPPLVEAIVGHLRGIRAP